MARREDPSTPRPRGLVLLLGLVVAGSTWQFAARNGMAEPSSASLAPLRREVPARPLPTRAPSVSFRQGLGLAKLGVPARTTARSRRMVPAGSETVGRSAPARGETRPASAKITARVIAAALPPIDAPLGAASSREEIVPRPGLRSAGRSEPSDRAGAQAAIPEEVAPPAWAIVGADALRSARGQTRDSSGDDGAAVEDDGEFLDENDEDDSDAVTRPDGTADADSQGTQVLVVGPGLAGRGDLVTFTIQVENARNVAHSPLRLVFDPDVLQFVAAEEGSFLSGGGAATQFLARESGAAGVLEIAISRMPPARGIAGNGILCSVTFLAKRPGSSPLVLAGSGLLDPTGHRMSFRRNDADVAVH